VWRSFAKIEKRQHHVRQHNAQQQHVLKACKARNKLKTVLAQH
jgi:hypothetical protein